MTKRKPPLPPRDPPMDVRCSPCGTVYPTTYGAFKARTSVCPTCTSTKAYGLSATRMNTSTKSFG